RRDAPSRCRFRPSRSTFQARSAPSIEGALRLVAGELGRIEVVLRRAELAIDANAAVLGALLDFLGGEARKDFTDLLARARAIVDDRLPVVDAHAVLVEQPEQQPLGPDGRIDQFV